ncbi:hypothetical protein B0H15DRAFT_769294, partial [Mycena belliarum]
QFYTADWDDGRTTAAFFCAAAGAGSPILWYGRGWNAGGAGGAGIERATAGLRFLTARQFRVHGVRGWYAACSTSVRRVPPYARFVCLFGAVGPRPYYRTARTMGMSRRPRAGWGARGIMPFMLAVATEVNFAVSVLTGTAHEKLQVVHRWAAVLMYIASLVHTFPFIRTAVGMGTMRTSWSTGTVYWTGGAALVPQTYTMALSRGIVRNPYYEIFKKCVPPSIPPPTPADGGAACTSCAQPISCASRFKFRQLTAGTARRASSSCSCASRAGARTRSRSRPAPRAGIQRPRSWCAGGDADAELVVRVRGEITRALARRVDAAGGESQMRVVLDGVGAPLARFGRVLLLAGGRGASRAGWGGGADN